MGIHSVQHLARIARMESATGPPAAGSTTQGAENGYQVPPEDGGDLKNELSPQDIVYTEPAEGGSPQVVAGTDLRYQALEGVTGLKVVGSVDKNDEEGEEESEAEEEEDDDEERECPCCIGKTRFEDLTI